MASSFEADARMLSSTEDLSAELVDVAEDVLAGDYTPVHHHPAHGHTSHRLHVGAQVSTLDQQYGTVCFVGKVHFATGRWVGLDLGKPIGRNSGTVEGVQYFTTERKHGLFVRESDCLLVKPAADAGQDHGFVPFDYSDAREALVPVPAMPTAMAAGDDSTYECSEDAVVEHDRDSMKTLSESALSDDDSPRVAVAPVAAAAEAAEAAPREHERKQRRRRRGKSSRAEAAAPAAAAAGVGLAAGAAAGAAVATKSRAGEPDSVPVPSQTFMDPFEESDLRAFGVDADGVVHDVADASGESDEDEASEPEKELFTGPGAGVFNFDHYELTSKKIGVTSWRCCGRDVDTMDTAAIIDVELFQNCLHRRKNRGIITVYSQDATTPIVRMKVPNAVELFHELRSYISTKRRGEVTEVVNQKLLYEGAFHSTCWGYGCCCRVCDCCETHDEFKITNLTASKHTRSCCYSDHQQVSMRRVYDLSLDLVCLCSCCGKRCDRGFITAHTFDMSHPTFRIKVVGGDKAEKLFNSMSRYVDLKKAALLHWEKNRTANIISEAHNLRPRKP
ncbi:uncharacterized protein AMSG_09554 [Thecamonas trahens ATCC 50062]|uniref:CAP-Gly domain-containing protein n=1 Tax=Thecamonas trahens ATCC 50062 TaxID=461836 RepID=A0A0L0DNS3_THETB|nr:hypothetical protein AMSG_09554 [Thecamonas trahens ATCC 50062]KNC53915.1 hypothetical protein AMSG_09554 [Thecamonas trahens ATCC 50062]|eukprot:XP_013754121.1 hypothetical protein AMSG_09554 [Thecamonas trahens ATCC 50062]